MAFTGMIEHARREQPLECCGLLSGKDGIIENAHPAQNQQRSPTEFFVPVTELFAFFKGLRLAGEDHLGIYHSHPLTEAVPSARDIAEFHYAGVSYWIISLRGRNPEVRCFLWEDHGFQETSFEIDGDNLIPEAIKIGKNL